MTHFLDRRQALTLGAGAMLAAGLSLRSVAALAANNGTDAAIKAFARGKEPVKGKVKLDLPEIAENGNTVPMTVSVDVPMTPESYVEEVIILAEGNPNPGVITFRFTPSSVPEANTRIRLAETQNIVALARMNDGSVYSDTRQVKVTIGGCGG